MSKRSWIILAVIAVAGLLLNARNGHAPVIGQPAISPTPSPVGATARPSPTPTVDPAQLAQWHQRGATVVPPADLNALIPVDTIEMSDQVPGISRDTAKQWLTGLVQTTRWKSWAVSSVQPDFLSNLTVPPYSEADLVAFLKKARDAGTRVSFTKPFVISRVFLLPLSTQDQAQVVSAGGAPSSVVWLATYRGPVSVSIGDGKGDNTLTIFNQDYVDVAEGGRLVNDPMLGPIWQESFFYPCNGAGFSLSICPS